MMARALRTAMAAGVLACLLISSQAFATIYYVDQRNPAASDSNPGTAALPFRTVNKGTQTAVAGDTIVVKAGIYREAPSLKNSGEEGNPITLRGADGERAVISGADEITGWQPATLAVTRNNPHYQNIHYVDLTWAPAQLAQDEQVLTRAREPNVGWWVAQGGETDTLVDPVNLNQPAGTWIGGKVFLWDLDVTGQYERTITDYDPGTGTLTVNAVWYGTRVPAPNADRYFLSNRVEILDREGEWAVEDQGNGTYRVFVWPIGSGRPDGHRFEGARRSRFIIELGARINWVIDNLELRNAAGHGVGNWSSGVDPRNNVVSNCAIHSNLGTGIYGRYNGGGWYYRNLIKDNGAGVSLSDQPNVLVEENELADNQYDGIDANVNFATLRRNYIHGHWIWGHADNMQTWGGLHDITIDRNLVINGGQSYMIEGVNGLTITGNTILGSNAYMLIFGHGTVFNADVSGNTLCWPGYGLCSFTGDGYHLLDNICVKGHEGVMWGAGSTMDYSSDYNLFWHFDGITSYPYVWDGHYNYTLTQIQNASTNEAHSYYASPRFANAPFSYYQLAFGRNNSFSTNRIYINNNSANNMAQLAIGDHVEVDFDGVVRTVTAKGSDWVEVDPGDERLAFKYGCMLNWKANTNYAIDLTLLPGSPAIGTAHDGSNMGSSINVQQFMAGDFTGDDVRDTPPWPRQQANLTAWQSVANAQPADAPDGGIDPRPDGVTQFRLLFDYPLSAASATPSTITITGAASGNVSGLISGVALDDSDQTLVVTLSAPLPDGDTYLVTASPDLAASGDGPTRGAKSLVLAALAGDADGSATVTQADVLAVRSHLGQPVTPENARYDLDGDGVISARDMRLVRPYIGNALP